VTALLGQLVGARLRRDGIEVGFVAESVARSVVISGGGRSAAKEDGWRRLSCFATKPDGSELAKHTHPGEWRHGDEADPAILADLVERTVVDAMRLRDIGPTFPATGPVLFEPVAAGTVMHEVVGHLLETRQRAGPPLRAVGRGGFTNSAHRTDRAA
jgi:predicted Zn-dependent protease